MFLIVAIRVFYEAQTDIMSKMTMVVFFYKLLYKETHWFIGELKTSNIDWIWSDKSGNKSSFSFKRTALTAIFS